MFCLWGRWVVLVARLRLRKRSTGFGVLEAFKWHANVGPGGLVSYFLLFFANPVGDWMEVKVNAKKVSQTLPVVGNFLLMN